MNQIISGNMDVVIMAFATIISQVASSVHSQNNILTDGRVTCRYQQIPALLTAIDLYLREQGITDTSCVALECTNSVPGALTLLYLLARNYRFMLLPPTSDKEKLTDLKPLPAFCQYRLTLPPISDREISADSLHPATFLTINANEQYQAEPHATEQLRAKLYLRTSGSMGSAKIVVHAHDRLFANARNCVERFQLTSADRVTIAVPIFHMYGLGAGFLPAVIAGAALDLQEHTHLLKYLEHERQFQPTAAFLTPALCDMLLQRRGGARSYKVAVSAGARLKEEIIRAFDDRFGPLVNLYGSSELGAVSAAAPTDALELRTTTIGRPMADVTLAPAADLPALDVGEKPDASTSPAVAPRTDELYCQHPYGFETYIDDDGQEIAAAATWFKTGDLATFSPDGSIQILGRADNSINRDGYLVLLADIERAIEQIAAVAQVVVLTTPDERERGQYLAACCVLQPGTHLTAIQIRTQCFDILPRYAIPDEIRILDLLPTLPSGKVDRQALITQVGAIHD
jgi:acyl-CoA synthetase (AMP-forming)/AMP-acid ligase II